MFFFLPRASTGGRKMVRFYSLLVAGSLSAESLTALHSDSTRGIHEMRNAFKGSKSFVVTMWLNR